MEEACRELAHLLESPRSRSMARRLEQHLRRGDPTELRGIVWELQRSSGSQRIDDDDDFPNTL